MDLFKALLGGYFVVLGIVLILFHKAVRAFYEDWFGALLEYFPLQPRGRLITLSAILFGVLSIFGGSLLLLLAFPIE
jgi:hypothetical protein